MQVTLDSLKMGSLDQLLTTEEMEFLNDRLCCSVYIYEQSIQVLVYEWKKMDSNGD